MLDQIKQLMEMKKQADQIKRQLDAVNVDVETVPGIKLTISGSQNFKAVAIDERFLNPENKAQFEAQLLRSLNAAVGKSQAEAAARMRSVMPDFPGM